MSSTKVKVPGTVEGKIKMLIHVDLDVYEQIMNAKNRYSKNMGKAIKQSSFIVDSIFKPFIKASKEAGILK